LSSGCFSFEISSQKIFKACVPGKFKEISSSYRVTDKVRGVFTSTHEVWELLAEIHRGVTIHHLKNRTVSSTGIKSKQEVR
jgi:hypothetical protein